ncbi:hypothetical protein AB0436_11025 [Streptomyces sp. NPDC051322]|uniref:hypothetical protein n=1 Tax=Streptomyces sp. NPDC051322 TaxID=3154645 RepID=UPI00344EDE26
MGWTHDYGDAVPNHRSTTGLSTHERGGPHVRGLDPRLGIPRILRRRARWVSAWLRHPRP